MDFLTINNRQIEAEVLQQEINWLEDIIKVRLALYFDWENNHKTINEVVSPELKIYPDCFYKDLIRDFSENERLILILALVPYLKPQLLDDFLTINPRFQTKYTEFGGVLDSNHYGFLPTIETVFFILAGKNIDARISLMKVFNANHFLFRENILQKNEKTFNNSNTNVPVIISEAYLRMILGNKYQPQYSPNFPAQLLTTEMNWEDLVLSEKTLDQIKEIESWVKYSKQILRNPDNAKKLKKGYRALFFGEPGTGKTFTASLLGKTLDKPVYRIDLSSLVSKYVGETAKNLEKVFSEAENKEWILFFDEADALYGKRTAVENSHDRFANQEVSYLLQRVEDYNGLVILSTNEAKNIDTAFKRRFQSIIEFKLPLFQERWNLWQKAFANTGFQLDETVDLEFMAEYYAYISGADIIEVLRYSLLKAAQRENQTIYQQDLIDGLKREKQKKGSKWYEQLTSHREA